MPTMGSVPAACLKTSPILSLVYYFSMEQSSFLFCSFDLTLIDIDSKIECSQKGTIHFSFVAFIVWNY